MVKALIPRWEGFWPSAAGVLWCVGVALLVVGTALVSERSVFADSGDPGFCNGGATVIFHCDQQGQDDGSGYDQYMISCTGSMSINDCPFWCAKPADCNDGSLCLYAPCSGRFGRCCPRACACYATAPGKCGCAKRSAGGP